MIRAGDIQRAMIIGADTLSRISDPHDRDSMIYADGAGATVLEARQTDAGILAHASRLRHARSLRMLSMGRVQEEVFLEALFLNQDSGVGLARFQDRGAGAVRVDHAVAVVRIGDARERVAPMIMARWMSPARIMASAVMTPWIQPGQPKNEIERSRARFGDAQLRLHTSRQRGY